MEPATVKGKAEPMKPYKVLSPKEDPTKTHRLTGLRAELIGRKVEMAQLQEAVKNLKQGKGSIFSIVGDAGTGKSRLIEEFKASHRSQYRPMARGSLLCLLPEHPLFPPDRPSQPGLADPGRGSAGADKTERWRPEPDILLGERKDLIPYVGSLYSLKYPEIEGVSPEYWKAHLHEAIQLIWPISAGRSPTVICIEDLHWADPSSVELLRNILSDFRHPAIFLCIYRPSFSLFTSHQANAIKSYHEIRIQDLSPTDAQSMVESLLKTEAIPADLKKFIREKVEGNPFYLEEVINSLLETAILIPQDGQWVLTKPITEANIPSTVQGVISARLDRLEMEAKRILQEASVIGRAFLYEILKRITGLREQIDKNLMGLERLDLIRTRSLQPDLEYIFKHALTQEVVYNGLLKKERQNIHEKIGLVMEELFQDRLPEFYEALAYHFKQGYSTVKAADYLMKAGEKSFNRHALEESHQYYREAFELLSNKFDKSKEDEALLVDILLQWALVYQRRASFVEWSDLFENQENIVISLGDKERTGMFYARLGAAMEFRAKYREAYQYLRKALELGEEIKNKRVIGYACGFLAWNCPELGMTNEAVTFGKQAQALDIYESDPELFRYSTFGLGYAYWFRGEAGKAKDTANAIIAYGQRHSHTACMADGYIVLAFGHSVAGDFPAAIESAQKAIHFTPEPLTLLGLKIMLGMSFVANGQYQEGENVLREIEHSAEPGFEMS